MGTQTQCNCNEPDNSTKTERENRPIGRFHKIRDNPERKRNANKSMKSEKGTYSSKILQNDSGNPEDTIKVRDGMKIGKGTGPTKNVYWSKMLRRRKMVFPESQDQS